MTKKIAKRIINHPNPVNIGGGGGVGPQPDKKTGH
jgi:hypothetical protein